jgi:hypothetical protein
MEQSWIKLLKSSASPWWKTTSWQISAVHTPTKWFVSNTRLLRHFECVSFAFVPVSLGLGLDLAFGLQTFCFCLMRGIFQGMLDQHSCDLAMVVFLTSSGQQQKREKHHSTTTYTCPRIHVWSVDFESQAFHVKGQKLELGRGTTKHLCYTR